MVEHSNPEEIGQEFVQSNFGNSFLESTLHQMWTLDLKKVDKEGINELFFKEFPVKSSKKTYKYCWWEAEKEGYY